MNICSPKNSIFGLLCLIVFLFLSICALHLLHSLRHCPLCLLWFRGIPGKIKICPCEIQLVYVYMLTAFIRQFNGDCLNVRRSSGLSLLLYTKITLLWLGLIVFGWCFDPVGLKVFFNYCLSDLVVCFILPHFAVSPCCICICLDEHILQGTEQTSRQAGSLLRL